MHGDIINNMKNRLVAQILNRVADFMDLKGDEFRSKAYRRAARTIELLGEDIEEVAAQDRLQELPGVGRNIASKIREILDTGSLHLLHELMEEYPVDFDALSVTLSMSTTGSLVPSTRPVGCPIISTTSWSMAPRSLSVTLKGVPKGRPRQGWPLR